MSAFAGDSMAIQLSQRLACALLRKGVDHKEYGNFFSMSDSAAIGYYNFSAASSEASSLLPSSSSSSLSSPDVPASADLFQTMYRVANGIGLSDNLGRYQAHIPGIDKACGDTVLNVTCRVDFASAYIYARTISEFERYMGQAKWSRTLHLYTLPIIHKHSWEYLPLAKALLVTATSFARIKSKLVVMSPLAQHFSQHPQGQYVNISKLVVSRQQQAQHVLAMAQQPPACVPHTQHMLAHPDSLLFTAAIASIDPNWADKLGWLDVTKYSVPWHDLHPESGSTGWVVDCTHYAYNPMMYEPIWHDMAAYIETSAHH